MKILSWNSRGINNPKTVQALRTWCWRERPDFVFVMKSMIDSSRLEIVRNKCGFPNGLCISNNGNSGGIGLWWRDHNVSLISYSDRHILALVEDDYDSRKWCINGIYGWPERANKHKTWELMKSLVDRPDDSPYIVFGDFNEILRGDEKEGGAIRCDQDMNAFCKCTEECNIVDLGFRGSCFT